MVFLGAEFYPPAPPPRQEEEIESEYDEVQPFVPGQPTIFEPSPPPAPEPKVAKRPRTPRKRTDGNTAPRAAKVATPRKRTSTATRKKPPQGNG